MSKQLLSYQMFVEKAEAEKIPFSDILGGAVLEETVRRISDSEYFSKLWLRNGSILGKGQYEKNLTLFLEYDYVIEKRKKEDVDKTKEMLLCEISQKLKEEVFGGNEYGIVFTVKDKLFKKYMQLQLQAELEEMKVPVSIKVFLLEDNKKVPRKESFSSMMFPKLTIDYYSYPTEGFLAEKFMDIIMRLELIQNMSPYYDIYYYLEHKSVDGRKVKEYIEEQCEKNEIAKEKIHPEVIASYKDYTYMKKKWKVFLRSVNSREPGWDMVVERFSRFFEPIWQAISEDLVFFGDWMPDLNRFL